METKTGRERRIARYSAARVSGDTTKNSLQIGATYAYHGDKIHSGLYSPFMENTNVSKLLFKTLKKIITKAYTTSTAVDFRVIFREKIGIRCMPSFFREKGPKRYGN